MISLDVMDTVYPLMEMYKFKIYQYDGSLVTLFFNSLEDVDIFVYRYDVCRVVYYPDTNSYFVDMELEDLV